jgi:hypothetical protein
VGRVAALLFALGVLLALGPHVPLLGRAVAAVTPGWRYPFKYFCVASLGLSLLVARGLDNLLLRLERRHAPTRLAGGLAWTVVVVAAIECITGTRSLQPLLPAGALFAETPEIARLARDTAPDGPRVDGPPVVSLERLERRGRLIARGHVLDAMRERVVLLEGALPMMYGVHATWGASALPPAAQLARVRAARSPRDLDAGFLLVPLQPREGEAAGATVREVPGAGPFPQRRWDGPNEAIGAPGLPPPSSYPGWREGPPGRWRFRPTGWYPLLLLSGSTWIVLAVLGWPRR